MNRRKFIRSLCATAVMPAALANAQTGVIAKKVTCARSVAALERHIKRNLP